VGLAFPLKETLTTPRWATFNVEFKQTGQYIKLLCQKDETCKGEEMIAEKHKIETFDGLKLEASIVENGSPVWLIVTHGLGEHSDRHQYMDRNFSQYFNICRYDLRGHGDSDGKRVSVDSFSDYTKDLDIILNYLKEKFQMDRYILFGHSMGALITSSYMQKIASTHFYPEKVFLSGPPVAAPGALGSFFHLAPLGISKTLSNLGLSIALGGMLDIKKLSHDPRVYEAYIKDPKNSLKIETKLFFSILAESKEVFSRKLRVSCPLYVAIGTNDVLIDAQRAANYFKTTEKNASLLEVKDGYHELHNEIEKYKKPYFKFLKESLIESIYS
jgi:alpha-beta hydrolase superfamily lysophospholipase